VDTGDQGIGLINFVRLFAITNLIFVSSFGPGRFNYQAFACYDVLNGGKQKLSEYGVWTGDA
jgi:hypothetical protein